jgi:hypothetical protein
MLRSVFLFKSVKQMCDDFCFKLKGVHEAQKGGAQAKTVTIKGSW